MSLSIPFGVSRNPRPKGIVWFPVGTWNFPRFQTMDDSCDGAINLEEFSKLVPGSWVFSWPVSWFQTFFFFGGILKGKSWGKPWQFCELTWPLLGDAWVSDWKSDPKRQKVGENRELQGFGGIKGRSRRLESPAGCFFLKKMTGVPRIVGQLTQT